MSQLRVGTGERHDACLPGEVNLGQLLSAISLAFDFAERAQLNHARRVAYLAFRMGEQLELENELLRRVLFAGMLHDIGATEGFDELRSDAGVLSPVIRDHPLRGAKMVAGLPGVSDLSPVLAQHHEKWAGGGYPFGLAGESIRLEARLLYLADRFEVAYAAGGWEAGVTRVERGRGAHFQPALVDAFLALARLPRTQLDLEEHNIGRVVAWEVERFAQLVVKAELRQVAGVFAAFIDNRSRYTANHSQGVAEYAGRLARRMGLAHAAAIEIGALLHDLGKVGVPSRILDKPGRLTPEEYQLIKVHPYYTEHILRQVKGFEEIVPWAALHHEHLDGTGYHTGAKTTAIPLESRIVAVSDVFQALTADRPYRPGLAREDALKLMRDMAGARRLDPEVVEGLAEAV